MKEEQKSIANVAAEELTDQNRAFIFHLVHGKSESGNSLTVYEAYQKAGYNGDKHAAYQLKSRLEKELMAAYANNGASRSDIFRDIADLMQLPVVDATGQLASGISVTNKIKLLHLATAAHKDVAPEAPKITAININMGEPKTVIVQDAEIIKGEDNGGTGSGSGQ